MSNINNDSFDLITNKNGEVVFFIYKNNYIKKNVFFDIDLSHNNLYFMYNNRQIISFKNVSLNILNLIKNKPKITINEVSRVEEKITSTYLVSKKY